MANYEAHREEYRGYTIVVEDDEGGYSCNPREEHENAATLYTWEREYGSPDGYKGKPEFGSHDFDQDTMDCIVEPPYQPGDIPGLKRIYTYKPNADNLCDGSFMAYRWQRRKDRHSKDDGLIILGLMREYDGSLEACEYDPDEFSGEYRRRWRPIGVAYMTYERARAEWGKRGRPWAEVRRLALDCIRSEVEVYSAWATGQVFGYRILDAYGDEVDDEDCSCGGFIGDPSEDPYVIEEARRAVDGLIEQAAKEAERVAELTAGGDDLMALVGAHGATGYEQE